MKKVPIILIIFFLIFNINAQWIQVSTINTSYLKSITFFNENSGYCSGAGGIWKTTNGGYNWFQILSANVTIKSMQFIDSLNAYAYGSNPGKLFKTVDGGQNWLENPLGGPVEEIAFFNLNTGVTVGFQIIQRTTNGGANWVRQDSTFFTEQFSVRTILNSPYGWLCGGAPTKVVRKTLNYGATWTFATPSGMGSLSGIWPVTANYVFACGYFGVIQRTTDGGSTWTRQDSLTSRILRAITFVNANTGTIVGDIGIILHTTNSGNNWSFQSSPTSQALYGVTFINANTGWITGSNGVILKTTNGGFLPIVPLSNSIPNSFSLYQNYPNPFNPTTHLRFEIPELRFVKLIVYDLLGREVSTLVNEELKPGTYEVEWPAPSEDGTYYSSGVYFYKLSAGDFIESKKMTLIK